MYFPAEALRPAFALRRAAPRQTGRETFIEDSPQPDTKQVAMALLQPKLSLKVAQRQILTPGLMQMVSVLALNKLELKEMIQSEMVENPVLDELEESVPLLDDVEGRQAE